MHCVRVRAKRDRIEQRAEAEADIRLPSLAVAVGHPQHEVRGGACLRGRIVDANAHEHGLDPQAEVLEGGGERQIVLKAVPITLLCHNHALEVSRLECYWDAPWRFELLRSDRRG